MENRITFKTQVEYNLELLTPETMVLVGSTKSKWWKCARFRKYWSSVLVHCNIVSNDYQHDWRVLYTIIPNKPRIMINNNIIIKHHNKSEF